MVHPLIGEALRLPLMIGVCMRSKFEELSIYYKEVIPIICISYDTSSGCGPKQESLKVWESVRAPTPRELFSAHGRLRTVTSDSLLASLPHALSHLSST